MSDLRSAADFHLVEYQSLRDEMTVRITQMGDINRNYLISVFAVLAWLLTYQSSLDLFTLSVGAILPYLVTHYFAGYRKDHSNSIWFLASYLQSLEEKYADPGYGWQRVVSAKKELNGKLYSRTANVFLYARIGAIFFAIYFFAVRIYPTAFGYPISNILIRYSHVN